MAAREADAGRRIRRTYPVRPFIGVGAIVLRGDDVLLVKRARPPRKGEWSIPGGMQHLGETVAEALRREVREETGLEVEPVDVVAVVDSIFRDESGRVKYHYTLVDMLAAWRQGDPRAADDAAECAWVPLAQLDAYGLWAETRRVIALADSRRRKS